VKRGEVFQAEYSIPGELGSLAATLRKLATFDVDEAFSGEGLSGRERFVLIENRTAELLHLLVVKYSKQVEMRGRYL
jgi:hypothetical protein